MIIMNIKKVFNAFLMIMTIGFICWGIFDIIIQNTDFIADRFYLAGISFLALLIYERMHISIPILLFGSLPIALHSIGWYHVVWFGLPYDHYLHFSAGLAIGLIFYESLKKTTKISTLGLFAITICIVGGIGSFMEIFEFLGYTFFGEGGGILFYGSGDYGENKKMKIPKHAKKVFRGEIFNVYHWEQEMFDGSKETFEMLKRPNTVQVIAVQNDKILLAKEEQPTKPLYYSLFGGRQDVDSTPLKAAKRELLEESGLTSEVWELYLEEEPYTKMEWTVYTYIARDCKKIQEQKLDAGEKIEIVAVDFEEFIRIILSERFFGKELILDVLRRQAAGTLQQLKKKIFS